MKLQLDTYLIGDENMKLVVTVVGQDRVGIIAGVTRVLADNEVCLLYTSPSPRDKRQSRMPSSA